MNVVKDEKKFEDLTIDELREIVINQQKAMQKMGMQNMFARLDFLFKVIENSDKFEQSFVDKMTTEIVNLMTIDNKNVDNDI